MSILVAWVGNADLRAAASEPDAGKGPLLGAVQAMPFEVVHVLSDHPAEKTKTYASWLRDQGRVSVVEHQTKLTSPTDHKDIYREATSVLSEILRQSPSAALTLHLSPGTPAMASIWLLSAKTRFPARHRRDAVAVSPG